MGARETNLVECGIFSAENLGATKSLRLMENCQNPLGRGEFPFLKGMRGMPLLKLAGKATKKIEMERRKAQLPGLEQRRRGKEWKNLKDILFFLPIGGWLLFLRLLFMMGEDWRGKMLVGGCICPFHISPLRCLGNEMGGGRRAHLFPPSFFSFSIFSLLRRIFVGGK